MTKYLVLLIVAAAVRGGGAVDADELTAAKSPQQRAASQQRLAREQTAAAKTFGLPAAITNSIGMQMVLIPAGEFVMGAPEESNLVLQNRTLLCCPGHSQGKRASHWPALSAVKPPASRSSTLR
jgi:formylglycine-generating enzyme required for sulfatase activity